MFGLGEGPAVMQEGAIGWGDAVKAGEDGSVDVSTWRDRDPRSRLIGVI